MATGITHPTVTNFKTKLGSGGARHNLFEIDLSPDATGTSQNLFLVKAGQIPGSTIAILPINHSGRVLKIPGLRTFDDWTCTIINDELMGIRKALINWMLEMSGNADGQRTEKGVVTTPAVLNADKSVLTAAVTAPTQYGLPGYKSRDIKITQYDQQGSKKQTYTLHKAWPNSIGEIPLDWATDGIQEYPVTFSYDWWSHKATDGATSLKLEGTEGSKPTFSDQTVAASS